MELRKFRSLVDEKDRDDFGMSGLTFEVDSLVKGKVYTQADTTYYDARAKASAPFFVDDNGCSRDIGHMLEKGLVEEILIGMEIAIDFDGTCTTHDYPRIGADIGAIPVLKKLVEAGHRLILYTMRSKDDLQDAVNWFAKNDIPLYGIGRNPTQSEWTTSRKCYAQLYIDDAALGCPLTANTNISPRPFVDWKKVEKYLVNHKII
jgi:hypothetical protein